MTELFQRVDVSGDLQLIELPQLIDKGIFLYADYSCFYIKNSRHYFAYFKSDYVEGACALIKENLGLFEYKGRLTELVRAKGYGSYMYPKMYSVLLRYIDLMTV